MTKYYWFTVKFLKSSEKMQPHTIAEKIMLPACNEIVKRILGENTEKKIKGSFSNDTISQRIDDISSDIQYQVREKLSDRRVLHCSSIELMNRLI